MIYNDTLNDYKNLIRSFIIYIVLLVILFIINISLICGLIYFYWYLKRDNTSITNINANNEIVVY